MREKPEEYVKGYCRKSSCNGFFLFPVKGLSTKEQITEALRQMGYRCPGSGRPHQEKGMLLSGYKWEETGDAYVIYGRKAVDGGSSGVGDPG
jgi:hypothetical protein